MVQRPRPKFSHGISKGEKDPFWIPLGSKFLRNAVKLLRKWEGVVAKITNVLIKSAEAGSV